MRLILKVVSILLTITMATAVFSGCSLFMDYSSDYEKYLETDFSNMGYSQPDLERFYELSEMIEKSCGKFYNALSVNDYFNEMVDIYNSVYAMISLLNIYTALDVTDEFYAEEYLYLQNELYNVSNELERIAGVIKDSSCAYLIEFYNGADIWDYFGDYNVSESDEEFESLSMQENVLLSKYNELLAIDFTIPADDVTGYEEFSEDDLLNISELELMYEAGILNNDQLLELEREIYEKKNAAFGEVYLDLVEVRNKIALNREYGSYSEYAYSTLYSRTYTAEDLKDMRKYVKSDIVPLLNKLTESLDYDALADGDAYMSTAYTENLNGIITPVLGQLSEDMLEVYEQMREDNRCSLGYSETKRPSAFTAYVDLYNVPYLFCSPQELPTGYDFFTVVHEFGHFFAYSTVSLTEYNMSDLDSQEVLSQCLELMFVEHAGEIFTEDKVASAQYLQVIIQILASVVEGCKLDEFQERVYACENPDIDTVNKIYGDLMYEYGTDFYDTGDGQSLSWIDIEHNFIAPFYYISYAASAVASLQMWSSDNCTENYFNFLNNTEDMYFMDNIEKCGLKSPFLTETLESIKKTVEEKVSVLQY